MSVYLDASVLVAAFIDDKFSPRADAFLRSTSTDVIVSDFASLEFSSVVARKVRARELRRKEALAAFENFDVWSIRVASRAETHPTDLEVASSFVRRLDLALKGPDAMNIAIAIRLRAAIATFDRRMAECARALGGETAAV